MSHIYAHHHGFLLEYVAICTVLKYVVGPFEFKIDFLNHLNVSILLKHECLIPKAKIKVLDIVGSP